MLVPAWSPSGRCAFGVSAIPNRKDDAFINRSRHRYTPRNLPAGQIRQPAPGSRHYGNRWGLWQHKFAGVRTRSFAELSAFGISMYIVVGGARVARTPVADGTDLPSRL